ncbi:MAG: ATP-binding cassette domain-containing protein [Leptospirales bacterium]|jgi:ATPase subunit of ABC transporter with duplicated ATPase domains
MHSLIALRGVGLTFADHSCFENITAELRAGERIGLIGPNGAGKSSLLKLLAGEEPPGGHVDGYVERSVGLRVLRLGQFPETVAALDRSGGEVFQHEFARALRAAPDVLLLDEPGNHLDARNRSLLIRRIQNYSGAVIVASHDLKLLRACCPQLWALEANPAHNVRTAARYRLRVFAGDYDAYLRERAAEGRAHAAAEMELRARERYLRNQRDREIRRAASSRRTNRNENDRNLLRAMQERGSRTAGKHGRRTAARQERLAKEFVEHRNRGELRRVPRFHFQALEASSTGRALATVRQGTAGYGSGGPVFAPISFTLNAGDRLAVTGDNGDGKSTLLRAMISDPLIQRGGEWHVPAPGRAGVERVAHIDQFFAQLNPRRSVFEELRSVRPDWPPAQLRRHLNDALFSTNAEVARLVRDLSGGERARLSFSRVAARPPRLLLLDEINNQLDLDSREIVVSAVSEYIARGGTLMIVAHESEFLRAIGVTTELRVTRHASIRDTDAD